MKILIILAVLICFIVIRKIIQIIYELRMTPTMKFIYTVNATTPILRFKTCIDIYGYRYHLLTRKFAAWVLNGGWGVSSKEDTLDMIDWLLNEGHNDEFMPMLEDFMDKYREDDMLFTKFEGEDALLMEAAQKCPDQGILAWDLCRVTYVVGGAYLAGWLSYKESIEYCLEACRILQENFDSWEQMAESCYIGHQYWSESSDENRSRRESFNKFLTKKKFKVMWDTELNEKDIIHARII